MRSTPPSNILVFADLDPAEHKSRTASAIYDAIPQPHPVKPPSAAISSFLPVAAYLSGCALSVGAITVPRQRAIFSSKLLLRFMNFFVNVSLPRLPFLVRPYYHHPGGVPSSWVRLLYNFFVVLGLG
jgi:hypothetical protein